MSWTEERVAELTRLWNEGKTTGEIGKILGVSKNAVVGKSHRLGLAGRPSPIKRVPRVAAPKPVVVESSGPRITSVVGLSAAACRWPYGDPRDKDFHFCGKGAVGGKPYCADHAAIAYVSSSKKDKVA